MPITAGWYHSSFGFLDYLVDQGLPGTNHVASVATHQPATDTAPGAQAALWADILVVLVGLAALSLVALALRHRVATGAR
jgi:hypothetical protein